MPRISTVRGARAVACALLLALAGCGSLGDTPAAGGRFSIAMIPDTQNMVDFKHQKAHGFPFDASVEIDWYTGIKPKTGPITWDIGFIYYSYPNAFTPGLNLEYYELKLGASAQVWKDGTLGVTAFYSPDYSLESGRTWTIETAFAQAFPAMWGITPMFSALLGYQTNEGTDSYRFSFGNGDDQYFYWNAGVVLGFLEKWSLDLRYWDTDISNAGNFCDLDTFQCDARFVATLKFTY